MRFQVNNLTDEPLRMYRDNQPNRIGRYDEYGRRYLLDLTVQLLRILLWQVPGREAAQPGCCGVVGATHRQTCDGRVWRFGPPRWS